ncbi:MAG: thermonuclease family protein [Flavihumibacter sp.]
MHFFPLLFSCLLLLQAPPAGPALLSGTAVRIADGDTFTLLTPGNTTHRIRLNAIDAPEKKQDYYRVSKAALGNILAGKTIRVAVTGSDRYGRLLANVYTPGNDSTVNLRLVSAGLAWHFTRYSKDPVLAQAEQNAKAQQRGLWQQPHPVAPWEFRAAARQGTKKQALKKTNTAALLQ